MDEEKLSWMCTVDDCERPKVGGLDVCMSHKQAQSKQERIDSAPVKPSTPLRRGSPPKKQSDKRAGQVNEYNAKVKKWKEGKTCVMCDWEGLKRPCEHAHHPAGREGERLLNFAELVPLCAKHHIWVTDHSKEAIELGISKPRNATI